MTLAAFADLAEVIGAFGVIAGLIFVGMQMRQNTIQLRRAERNVTNSEASVVRQAMLLNTDVAELMTASMTGSRALTDVETNRLISMFWEIGFHAIQFWDRTQHGIFNRDIFEKAVVVWTPYITTPHGLNWWRMARAFYDPAFVETMERLIPALKPAAIEASA